MSESLIIKDGNGSIKNLQVDSGSNGYISNHALVSTVTGTVIKQYYTNAPDGWNWDNATSGTVLISGLDKSRKGIIICNKSDDSSCYLLLGSMADTSNNCGFGALTSVSQPPQKYSLILEAGGTYFADSMTSALGHAMFVASSSNIPDSSSMMVTVTEIY